MKIIFIIYLVTLFNIVNCQAQLPSGTILHLKADAGLVLNGDKVVEWQDQTNSEIKAFQTDGSLQPVYVSDGINGKPTVRFDGTKFLEASAVFPVFEDYSLFFVVSISSFNYYNMMVSGNGHGVFYNPPRAFHTNTSVQAISNKTLSLNKPALMSVIYTESTQTVKLYMDGVLVAEAQVGSNYDPIIFLGAYYQNYFLCGDIPEVILYERAMDNAEQKSAESYLFDKYLIERPEDGLPDKTFTAIPANYQLFPRDKDNYTNVKIAGNFKQTKFNKISVKVYKNNKITETISQNLDFVNGSAAFNFDCKIHAELSNYKFLISAVNSSRDSIMKVRHNIVAGDVILLDGQSNTQANNNYYDINDFIRTFGGNFSNSAADTLWALGDDWSTGLLTNIGAWGMTLAQRILENQKVPVCVINGAVGGTIIESHLPVPGDRYNLSSIYGSMLYRVEKAKLKNAARALFWYQGESNGVWDYENNFITLTNEWLKDYPNIQKIYTVQIHTGCGGGYTHSQLREVERRMPEIIKNVKVETIAASGLPGHDGCHYELIGYQTLGEQLYRQYNRDFFGSKDTVAISSPNISEAFFTSPSKEQIALVFKPKLTKMRAQADTVVSGIEASLKDYIYLSDGAKIMSINCVNDTVFLNLDRGSKSQTITYVPELYYHDSYIIYEGPWFFNQRNMGALTFDQFPIVEKKAIIIDNFTKELIACANTENNFIICAASESGGAVAQYQWYKDGVELSGETNPKLDFPNFDYPISGIYQCKVSAKGDSKALLSGDIPVYALSLPEITDQPKEIINAQIGGIYSFEVKAHYRGKVPPYYKQFFQWYKYTAATNEFTPLPNGGKFAGATSSILIVTGLSDEDFCRNGDYYFVEIVSQCGSVRSNPFIISQKPEIVFRDNPKDFNVCANTDVVFEAFAIAPVGYAIDYSWQKDGVDLINNAQYNGVNTTKLQIFNVDITQMGSYKCIAKIVSENISVESTAGTLTFKSEPIAAALSDANPTVKRGNDVAFKVELLAGAEPLTVGWKFNGEIIKESVWDEFNSDKLLTLLLESVNENQAGEYICYLENECALKEVNFHLNVTKWDEANSVEEISENGYSLYTAIPNPTNETATIKYIMPRSGLVKFTLSDISGRTIRNLFEGYAVEGMNTLLINVKQLHLSTGVYFYTMTSENFSGVRSIIVE
ncbi:MAG: sialate O-acetylesterase [bacterium]